MIHTLKFISIFLFILACLVGFSFFVPSTDTGIQEKQLMTQSGELTTSWTIEQVQSRVLSILRDTEVQKTLKSIKEDNPRYYKDGAIFMNRERLLPVQEDKSYYSEWTVKTPGESDRGARRIIEGKWGELYFTDDHYISFTRIR